MMLLLIGLFVGGITGFLIAALLAAGREPERQDAAPTVHDGEE